MRALGSPRQHRGPRHATETAPLGIAHSVRLLLGTMGFGDGGEPDDEAAAEDERPAGGGHLTGTGLPTGPGGRWAAAPRSTGAAEERADGPLPPLLGRGAHPVRRARPAEVCGEAPAGSPADGTPGGAVDRSAREWQRACLRARTAAADLGAAFGVHAKVLAVAAEGDEVVLTAHFSDLRAWRAHCSLLGVHPDAVTRHADACVATGEQGGVAVRLIGHGVPILLEAMAAVMREPYPLWGQVYDLAAVHRDGGGNLWEYRGARSVEGVPLLSPLGRAERCRITDVVREIGPLDQVADDARAGGPVAAAPPGRSPGG